jgi:hypothetical protein
MQSSTQKIRKKWTNITVLIFAYNIILVYLLRICCVDGCIIILYSNTQQDADNKDEISRASTGTKETMEREL